MRALLSDKAKRLRAEGIDFDPEHVEIGDLPQDFQEPFGLGVEIEIEQDVDIGPGALPDRFQMYAQIMQHPALDIELGQERCAEAWTPAGRLATIIGEDVRLERGELLFAHLAADRLDAIEAFDRGLVPRRMVDAPSGTMRPVNPHPVADLAA